jgi:glucose-6-phosphate dehydrogenase assembly protein OpcA
MAGIERVEALAGRLILDSEDGPDPCSVLSRVMDPRHRPGAAVVVSDLAWTRLTGFRQTVAQALEGAQPGDIGEVRISHGAGAVPVSARYMAGWMATALGWTPDDPRLSFAAGGFDGVDLAGSGLALSLRRTGERERSDAELIGEELSIPGRDPVYERSLAAALSIAGRVR